MKKLHHSLMVIGILIWLSACEGRDSQTTPTLDAPATSTQAVATVTSEPSATPTVTPRPTETPTPLVSSTPTPILPTPALPFANGSGFPFSQFFFDNSGYPGCELPCWKGLTIGKSGSDQVQEMFDKKFGFNGMLNFRTGTPVGKDDLGLGSLTGNYLMGYYWYNRPSGLFDIAAILNQDADLLEGFAFGWTVDQAPSFQVDMTPQHFLQHLGTPAQMLVSANISESATVGGLDLIMVYDQGIVFKWVSSVPMTLSNGSLTAKFCLGKSTVDAGTGLLGRIYIMGSLPPGPNHLTAFQQAVQTDVINRTIKNRGLVPFEDVFGITPAEATELALVGGDNCILSKNLFGK